MDNKNRQSTSKLFLETVEKEFRKKDFIPFYFRNFLKKFLLGVEELNKAINTSFLLIPWGKRDKKNKPIIAPELELLEYNAKQAGKIFGSLIDKALKERLQYRGFNHDVPAVVEAFFYFVFPYHQWEGKGLFTDQRETLEGFFRTCNACTGKGANPTRIDCFDSIVCIYALAMSLNLGLKKYDKLSMRACNIIFSIQKEYLVRRNWKGEKIYRRN